MTVTTVDDTVRRLSIGFVLTALAAALVAGVGAAPASAMPGRADKDVAPARCAALMLDGVELTVCAPFLPAAEFVAPAPDDALQVASAVVMTAPYQELVIQAVPFHTRLGTWPWAAAGSGAIYRGLLAEFRSQQGGAPQPGPTAELLGQRVPGQVSVVELNVRGLTPRPVMLAEWVLEAGERVWVVRYAREIRPRQAAAAAALDGLTLTSPDPGRPSTSLASLQAEAAAARSTTAEAAVAAAGDLPFPP